MSSKPPSLTTDRHNANRGTERGKKLVRKSLEDVGPGRSILLDRNEVVIAGNKTLEQAQALGIPVRIVKSDGKHLIAVQRTDLDLEEGDKARLAAFYDNRTAEVGLEWEEDELRAAVEKGIDLGDMFTPEELAKLIPPLPTELLTDADDVPDVQAEAVSETGDLWVLGEHRLLCGDATKAEDVERVMAGEKAALCLTDPPYGVGWDYEGTDDTKQNLDGLIGGFLPLVRERADAVLVTTGNGSQYMYPVHDWTLCWFCAAGVGRGPWGFTCWQPVLVYGKCPYLAHGLGSRPDAVEMGGGRDEVDHPCPKPNGVWAWLMERGSVLRGDFVLDVFAGSGTTLIAAEQLGRRARCIEIAPCYVDVSVRRWQNATGKRAVTETGKVMPDAEG